MMTSGSNKQLSCWIEATSVHSLTHALHGVEDLDNDDSVPSENSGINDFAQKAPDDKETQATGWHSLPSDSPRVRS